MGDTRSHKLLDRLRDAGVGQIIVRGRLGGRRLDCWAYDNGAFEDWQEAKRTGVAKPFDEAQFLADLRSIAAGDVPRPDFIVLPDVVGDGQRSLMTSLAWLRRLEAEHLRLAPLYFAAQDGMCVTDAPWGIIDGLFLGGTLGWKLRNAADWRFAAKARGVPFHYARCGTKRRIMQAMALRADSLDSCLPLWSTKKTRIFLDALAQEMLFHELPEEKPAPPVLAPLTPSEARLRPDSADFS